MNSVHAACDLLLSAPTNSTSFRLWESSGLKALLWGALKLPSSQAVLRYRTAIATFFRENFSYTEVLSFLAYTFSKALKGRKANNGNIVGANRCVRPWFLYAARVLGTIRVGWLTLNKQISLHYFCVSYISSNLIFTLMSCRTHVRHLCISLVILWQSFYISFYLSWWYISRVNSNIIVSFFYRVVQNI